MDKTHGWIHHLAEFFYLILQSFIYYSLLQFIYIRLDFAFFAIMVTDLGGCPSHYALYCR